jgi:signal transduction histidine kinase
MSLRLRLTLSYILFLVPAVVVFGLVVYFVASARLYSALDDSLLARIQNLQLSLNEQNINNPSALRDSLAPLDVASSADFVFKVVSIDGRVLYASSREVATSLPDRSSMKVQPDQAMTWGPSSREVRVAYEAFPQEGTPRGYLVGAVSFKQTDAAIDELRGVFIVGGILVVMLTSAPAYFIAGRSLQPVRALSARASEIERSGDFTTALPSVSSRDEMAELVRTFNAMTERVRRMLVVQRDFLAQSSHELRRPLTVIRTYIDVLGHADLRDREREVSLKAMRSEVNSMSHLISDLLVLSRQETHSESRGPVDLAALAERVFARNRRRAGARTLTFAGCTDAMVEGDVEGLDHMIANLVDNALQYTPAAGSVDMTVQRQNGNVLLSVTDSGIGIPQTEQPQIFDRFFRGDKAREANGEGSGLGLVIVKQVAESHGGRVSFDSWPDRGSRFVVALPAIGNAEPTSVTFIPDSG